MRSKLAVSILIVSLCRLAFSSDASFSAIHLLGGYSATRESATDAVSWKIRGKSGFIIHFEAGPSEGSAINLKERAKYAWYREQMVHGQKVKLALIKPGLKTDPDLDAERNLPPGNIMLVTYPLGGHRSHAANFVGKIATQEEMIDMLLMALSFDPSKGSF